MSQHAHMAVHMFAGLPVRESPQQRCQLGRGGWGLVARLHDSVLADVDACTCR